MLHLLILQFIYLYSTFCKLKSKFIIMAVYFPQVAKPDRKKRRKKDADIVSKIITWNQIIVSFPFIMWLRLRFTSSRWKNTTATYSNPPSTAFPHTASTAHLSSGWWTKPASANVSFMSLNSVQHNQIVSHQTLGWSGEQFGFVAQDVFWNVGTDLEFILGGGACFFFRLIVCRVCWRAVKVRINEMSVSCAVCRYACHRKCCQKMTTKCSKKVKSFFFFYLNYIHVI